MYRVGKYARYPLEITNQQRSSKGRAPLRRAYFDFNPHAPASTKIPMQPSMPETEESRQGNALDRMATDETTPLLPTPEQSKAEPENDTMSTLLWKIGAVYGATGVALGAFGAHGLKKHIAEPQKLANWSTAAQYQVTHPPATDRPLSCPFSCER
jgi:hypothetical protein